jgi:HPt (histidine-containing phosphotransfer) domain-containing protein
MDDYIAKPVDERILYSKIASLVNTSISSSPDERNKNENENDQIENVKCTDLGYLIHRTKSNSVLMTEMINLYLKQTPQLVNNMKQSLKAQDWNGLYSAVHKIIPSFAIMGINSDYENMAKTVQEFARTQQQTEGIPDLVLQLETVCSQACKELEEELIIIKNNTA